MFKINKKLLTALMVLSMTAASQVLAVTNGFGMNTAPPGIVTTDLASIIINITNWVLGFITLVAVLMLIWGGVQYLTASGDEANVEKAKHTITYAILGLIVVGIAYAVVVVIVNTFIGGSF